MKTVFSSSREIPHLWAHQTQSSARAGNVSFEGLKFYSYRTVIAQLVETKPGQFVAVFDSCRYSVSTAKHQSLAQSAVSHLLRYYVRRARKGNDSLTPNASDVSEKLREISDTIKECEAGRGSHKARFERMQSVPARVEQVREFAKVFKLGALSLPNEIKKALKPETLAEYQARAAKAEAARNTPAAIAKRAKGAEYRARKKAQAEAELQERRRIAALAFAEQQKEQIALWRTGAKAYFSHGYGMNSIPPMVRLIQDDGRDVVETSMGARVPLCAALKLFNYCQRVRELGREFIPSQEFKVGHYALQMITAEGAARVGCHLLPFDEMAALFAKLTPEQIAGGAEA
jgi:hypothetical protein